MSTLAAFKVERRSIAVAVFIGTRLDYTELRQLSSARERAEGSVVGFVTWITSTFRIDSAAMENSVSEHELRRVELVRTASKQLKTSGIPVWEFKKAELLAAFGVPPLTTRKELRSVITTLWPVLETGRREGILDAVALGLFVQTERLFTS